MTNLSIDKMFKDTLNYMIEGVAFMDTHAKVYEIYSHAGDHIATMPIFMIESTIVWMGTHPLPGLTFAW